MNNLWSNLSHIGTTPTMPFEKVRRIVLSNQIAFFTFCLLLVLNTSFLFVDFIPFDPVGFFTIPLVLTTPILNKFGKHTIGAFSLAALMPISMLLFSSVSKTLMPPPIPLLVYIFPKIILLSFLILPFILIDNKQRGLLIIAIAITITCIFLTDKVNVLLGVGIDFNKIELSSYNNLNTLLIFPIVIIILGFIFLNSINSSYENTIITQNKVLEEAKKKIEFTNNNFTESLSYAEHIQNSILPKKQIFDSCFADSFIYYKPKAIVSGDFYFLKKLEVNGAECIALAVADCTGHGVPGGFMSMLGLTSLNEIVQEGKFFNAADILNQLRGNIKTKLNQTGDFSEQKDGMDMALILYYPKKNIVEFSGAKNAIYLIHENRNSEIFKGDRMPIGIHLKEKPFTNHNIKISSGQMCYLFTDGIIDQMNTEGQKFMSRRLLHLITKISPEGCNKQSVTVADELNKWMNIDNKNPLEQIDDMTLIGIRFR